MKKVNVDYGEKKYDGHYIRIFKSKKKNVLKTVIFLKQMSLRKEKRYYTFFNLLKIIGWFGCPFVYKISMNCNGMVWLGVVCHIYIYIYI